MGKMEKLNVLVTGGTRGIGAGIVRTLAGAGHNVAFCGRGETEKFSNLATTLENEFKIKAAYYQCDVSSRDDHAKLLDSFLADFGNLDALVNNAGVAPEVRADLLEMTPESFDRVMNINLKGPFFLTQLAVKKIKDNPNDKFHCIVNIGSVSAEYASVNRGEYCISKAAVSMATKLWAVRLAEEGIAVYELRPGVIRSDMTGPVAEKYDKMIAGGLTLQKRWGLPEDIGKAVKMLLDGSLAYSTGQVIQIDGGLTVKRL